MSIAEAPAIPAWTLGDRLAKAMKDAKGGKVSNKAMATYLGCDRNTISNYVNDKTAPGLAVLRLWAVRTGWPLEWLRHGDDWHPTGPGLGESPTKWYAPVIAFDVRRAA